MTDVHDTLVAMRELLAVPERWTKDEDARNVDGFPVSASSEFATCFCLSGALFKEVGHCQVSDFVWETLAAHTLISPDDWNDAPERTHADVLALLDKAIAANPPSSGAAP